MFDGKANSDKMDRQGARTAPDLERKYKFGKSFSEVYDIAVDAQHQAAEAVEIVRRIEANGLDVNVVEKLNVAAGTITLKSEGLVIESDGFSLSAENGIVATKGNIGLWDISDEHGIWKATDNYLVKMVAPKAENEDVITVAKIENGVVTATPFLLKADGRTFQTAGEIGGWEISETALTKTVNRSDPNSASDYNVITTASLSGEGIFTANEFHRRSDDLLLMRDSVGLSDGRIFWRFESVGGGEPTEKVYLANIVYNGLNFVLWADLLNGTLGIRS